MLITLLSWVAEVGKVLGIIGLIVLIPFTIGGAVFFVRATEEDNKKEKKRIEVKGIWLVVLPFALIIGSLLLHLMTKFLINFLGN